MTSIDTVNGVIGNLVTSTYLREAIVKHGAMKMCYSVGNTINNT